MRTKPLTILLTLIFSMMSLSSFAETNESGSKDNDKQSIPDSEKLVVVWTSGDKDVAIKMVYMYTYNAAKNGWWKDVTFLIWGASAKLLSEDKDLQEYIAKMQKVGIKTIACKACADSYGVSDILSDLDITVRYAGVELTNYIKGDHHVVTF